MNWPLLIILGIGLLAFIVFLVRRNLKDKKEFENQLNNDYPKSKDQEGDIEIEEIIK